MMCKFLGILSQIKETKSTIITKIELCPIQPLLGFYYATLLLSYCCSWLFHIIVEYFLNNFYNIAMEVAYYHVILGICCKPEEFDH